MRLSSLTTRALSICDSGIGVGVGVGEAAGGSVAVMGDVGVASGERAVGVVRADKVGGV
jgi:hypothetical protein